MTDIDLSPLLTLSEVIYYHQRYQVCQIVSVNGRDKATEVGKSPSSVWFKFESSDMSRPYIHIPILESTEEFKGTSLQTRSVCLDMSNPEELKAFRPPEGKDGFPIVSFDLGSNKFMVFDLMFDGGWMDSLKEDELRLVHCNTVRFLTPEDHFKVMDGSLNACHTPTKFICDCCRHV